jgi:hypothetical protein
MSAHSRAPRMAIVDLGRPNAMGAARRLESWSMIAHAAGAEVEVVSLSSLPRATAADVAAVARQIARGLAVPEALSWSRSALATRLRDLAPDLTIFVTLRAWDTNIAASQRAVMLDLVDHLSANYAARAGAAHPFRGATLTALSRFHRRGEHVVIPFAQRLGTVVAAGSADARRLGAQWVPIVMDLPAQPVDNRHADHDLCFIGNLAYEPNIDALRQLATIWPALQARRPGTRLLIAGAHCGQAVQQLASGQGWTLIGEFAHLEHVLARATIAVAPMRIATGIQCKVLDAARHGIAQVVSPQVAEGFDPDFPVAVARSNDELVSKIATLLDDTTARTELSKASIVAMRDRYSADRWAPWMAGVLGDSGPAPRVGKQRAVIASG